MKKVQNDAEFIYVENAGIAYGDGCFGPTFYSTPSPPRPRMYFPTPPAADRASFPVARPKLNAPDRLFR
jgi:hypothetical protein